LESSSESFFPTLLHVTDVFVGSAASAEVINPLDPVEVLLQCLVIVLGLVLSAFFSGSEVAFFSGLNKTRFNDKDKKLDRVELRVQRLLDSPRRLLATILIGNTFANIVTAIFAAVVTGKLVELIGLPLWVIYSAEILVLTFTIVVLTEITPKILALKDT
jgi:putative hemolysin